MRALVNWQGTLRKGAKTRRGGPHSLWRQLGSVAAWGRTVAATRLRGAHLRENVLAGTRIWRELGSVARMAALPAPCSRVAARRGRKHALRTVPACHRAELPPSSSSADVVSCVQSVATPGTECFVLLVISHQSAYLFWRRFQGSAKSLRTLRRPTLTNQHVALTVNLAAELAALGFSPSSEKPLDLLFSSSASRSRAKWIRPHVAPASLPEGSVVLVSAHVALASPELCFCQIAHTRSRGAALMTGCTLCGTYAFVTIEGGLGERSQLTSARQLRACCEVLGLGRESRAGWAARYVFDGAASPMEAKLALLLSLPARFGGYGLPRPEMNASIRLSDAAYALYPHSPCRADLYWAKAKLDVEYDGRDYHGSDMHNKDVARQVALTTEGIDVVPLTYAQIYDASAFSQVANMIAGKLGYRLRIEAKDAAAKRRMLRRELDLVR